MPIGMACCMGWDSAGLAVWWLTVDGDDVPGRWFIVDREFRPVRDEGAGASLRGSRARY
jgi:hypothetical protein